jgi:uncharacterized damage-inducible protein DinB
MSQFSNPADGAAGAAASYTQALLDVLGDRDPLEVMTSTPAVIRDAVSKLTDEQLRRPEREGKWSVLNLLQHLSDTELIYATRMRFPVAQDRPPIVGFDQDAWVRKLWHGDESLEQIIGPYEAVRMSTLSFLRRLSDEEWERVGVHAERGDESVRHMVRLGGGHDLVHRAQLERIVRAVTGLSS